MTNDVLAVLGVGKSKKEQFKEKAAREGYSMTQAVRVWIALYMAGKLTLPKRKE